jgi:hypothetical protein
MEYDALQNLIDSLENEVNSTDPQRGYWKNLWALVNEVRSGFKGSRFPTAAEKQEAWERVNSLVALAEQRSAKEKRERAHKEREWNKRQDSSRRAADRIQGELTNTRPTTDLERMLATVILAPLYLIENLLRSALGLEQLDEVHEDLKNCSAHLKEAWRLFNDNKQDLLPGDKTETYKNLVSAQERLNAAWSRWKEAKNEFHENKRREYEARKAERDEKHRDFVRRVINNISKLEDKINKAEDALDRQRNHLSDLRDQYASAWSDSFKERCSDWIDQTKDKINDIEESIDRMREWLREEHNKLRD